MKFNLHDEVYSPSKEAIGIVKGYRTETLAHKKNKDKKLVRNYYFVKFNDGRIQWVYEKHLQHIHNFTKEFEVGLRELLINVNLKDKKNLPLVKKFFEEKRQIEEG